MYFEEKWFMVLCVRLNCMHMKVMTSNDRTENISDFEEGEIVDDDPTILNTNASLANKFDGNRSCNFNSEHPSKYSSRLPHGNSVSYMPVSASVNCVRETPSINSRRNRKRRIRRNAKRAYNNTILQRNRNRNFHPAVHGNTNWRRGLMGNERVRVRPGSSYEERLREFQFRREKSKGSSREVQEDKQIRMNTSLIETEGTCTSLLKRLVGSGSLDIKILDENIALDQGKIDSTIDNSIDETNKCLNPINRSVLNLSHNCGANINSLNHMEKQSSVKPILSTNEQEASSMDDADDEWALRLEALRTAVLKKHNERLKRGCLPKKNTNNTCDSVIDCLMDELEPISSLTSTNEASTANITVNSNDDFVTKSDGCSDMSMDSNYVSDEDPLRQDLILVTSPEVINDNGLDECGNAREVERSGLEISLQDGKGSNAVNVLLDMTDEELELRTLALQSVLQKKPLNSGVVANKNDFIATIPTNDKKEDNVEKTETVERKVDKVTMKGVKRKDIEDWEELDEDILRAQLLKTLSSKLPDHNHSILENVSASQDLTVIKTQRLATSSSSNKDIDIEHEIQCRLWTEKMVPELIISLNTSDSDSDPESSQIDFVKSLDLLLQEAKKKSENGAKPKIKKKVTSPKRCTKKVLVKKTCSSTPTAVKHLPIQQQEEYRQLKLKLVEKLSSNPSKNLAVAKTSNLKSVKASSLNNAVKHVAVSKAVLPQTVSKHITLSKGTSSKSHLNIPSKIGSHSLLIKGNTSKLSTQKAVSINLGTKKIKIDNTPFINKNQSSLDIGKKSGNQSSPSTLLKMSGTSSTSSTNISQLSLKRNNYGPLETKRVALKTQTKLINRVPAKALKITKSVSDSTVNSGKNAVINPSKLCSNSTSNNILKIDGKHVLVSDSLTSDTINNRLDNIVKVTEKNSGSVIKSPTLVDVTDQNCTTNSQSVKVIGESDVRSLKINSSILPAREEGGDTGSIKINQVNKNNSHIKKNEGNLDKENFFKNNTIGTVESSNDDNQQNILHRLSSAGLGNECERDLVTKLQEAQVKYSHTLALVKRLESQLKAAKKDLLDRGKTVDQLKEKISAPIKLSTPNVKVPEDVIFEDICQVKLPNPDQLLKDQPKDVNKCIWDADGVLCPFQLAGSCKDPLCSFLHIPNS